MTDELRSVGLGALIVLSGRVVVDKTLHQAEVAQASLRHFNTLILNKRTDDCATELYNIFGLDGHRTVSIIAARLTEHHVPVSFVTYFRDEYKDWEYPSTDNESSLNRNSKRIWSCGD